MPPQLLQATLDGEQLITVRLCRRLKSRLFPKERFQLVGEAGETNAIEAVQPRHEAHRKASQFILHTAQPVLYVQQTWTVRVSGLGETRLRMGRLLDDAARFGDASAAMGACWSPRQTVFRVFAPTAQAVRLVIADSPEAHRGLVLHEMTATMCGIWEVTIPGNLAGKYYSYRLSGRGFDPNREVTDICAVCTQGPRPRSLIVDLTSTDPPGFREHAQPRLASPVDAVIYEMHIRDFTIAGNSGVTAKGKYLGLTETGTHLPGNRPVCTGLDHLRELGITHVQLMPVQDFDNAESDDDCYNWGYMPMHFNSPDGWYASSRDGTARITELKQAIQTFHEHGIGVILDVVYNHTSPQAGFEMLVPDYYYRRTCRGTFSNGSGCGNEFRSESPMGRKFLLDSLIYWVCEYRVDGFRLDLMALIDPATTRKIKAELDTLRPGILVYGEPWTAGPTPLSPRSNRRHLRGTGIGAFNDTVRDAIKGGVSDREPGFIQAGERIRDIRHGLEGSIGLWTANPIESVNYFECHDNLTAWDKLAISAPDTPEEMRKRMLRLAALILFTSQGIPLMHAGQEFCRSKNGADNSYNLPDEINRIDWSLKETHAGVCAYHRGMIAIRKAHLLLRLPSRSEILRRISFPVIPNPRCVFCRLDGRALAGETAEDLVILLNGDDKEAEFPLPEGNWFVLADADRATPEPLGTINESATLPPHSGMLLAQ